MSEVLSAPEAARLIGVSVQQVKAWMRRADDPLPSVAVGTSGRVRKVLAEQIAPWLGREAARDVAAGGRPPVRRR
jgi:transposase